MAETGTDIEKAAYLLKAGQLVAIPTETVYGLAANALDARAVARIFEAKNRPTFDPLIVHVPGIEAVSAYAEAITSTSLQLAEHFWPGPLTLLVKKKAIIPDLVTSGLDTVGIRCPDHSLTRELLQQLPFPLAAPSANPFGYVSPTTPQHVEEQLGTRIAYILDGGVCNIGIESTIVGFEDEQAVVYRLGGLNTDEIKSITGELVIRTHSTSNPKAPGQLQSHYAPRKKVVLGDLTELIKHYDALRTGILSFQQDFHAPHQYILAPSGTLEEAARNLFTALRMLDKLPIDIIIAELAPEQGLGRAINDRLRRAAAE